MFSEARAHRQWYHPLLSCDRPPANRRMVMIKQVIDGKTYNTETARCLATVDLMGYRTDERGRFTTNTPKKVGTTSLYETRGGAYLLVRDYDPGAGFYAEHD